MRAMPDETTPAARSTPLFHQPWPGYWRTKNRLERLKRFKNLVIHRERWALEMQTVTPLAELFPGENLKECTFETVQRIEAELRESLMLVFYGMREVAIETHARYRTFDRIENRDKTWEYDLILDYFHMSDGDNRQKNFELLMGRLDMAIGIYKARLPRAKRELFSPITWIAYAVRLPITILERAGLLAHPKSQEKFLNAYGWAVQLATLAVILLILGHYGAKVPWSKIFSYLMSALPK